MRKAAIIMKSDAVFVPVVRQVELVREFERSVLSGIPRDVGESAGSGLRRKPPGEGNCLRRKFCGAGCGIFVTGPSWAVWLL